MGRPQFTESQIVFASASQTTTQTSADIPTNGALNLVFVLDATANPGGLGSVTVKVQGKDKASGKYYDILAGAAVTTVSTNRYKVLPNIAAVANSIAQDLIPDMIRFIVTANNANPMTYSLGCDLK